MTETIQCYIKKTEGQGELVFQLDVHKNPSHNPLSTNIRPNTNQSKPNENPIGPQPYKGINQMINLRETMLMKLTQHIKIIHFTSNIM